VRGECGVGADRISGADPVKAGIRLFSDPVISGPANSRLAGSWPEALYLKKIKNLVKFGKNLEKILRKYFKLSNYHMLHQEARSYYTLPFP
jgi:hypothetical protein